MISSVYWTKKENGSQYEIMKIVFFDIDGTLYDREDPRRIPQSTLLAIRKLQEEGNLAIICTGRCMSCIEPYIQNIGFDGYIAGCGTHIIYRGQELWYQVLSKDMIRELDILCKREETMPVFEGSSYLYVDEAGCSGSNLKFYRFYERFYEGKVRPVDYQASDVCKMTVRLNPDSKGISPEQSAAAKKKRITICSERMGMAVLDKGRSLEIFPQGSGKGEGIQRFLTLTGYLQADTYAFGDGINDITMMEQVNFGVALGHAHPGLLKVCSYETDDLYDDGIYKACRKLNLIS